MKQIALVLFIGFALSLCNLSERLHKGSGSSSNSSGGVTDNAAKPEPAQPTAAQTAALAGGSEAKWDRQGMSFTVPANWTETQEESKNLTWQSPGPGAASLIVSISPMAGEFPVDASIQAFFDGAAALIFAVAMLAFALPLILVFMLAFTVVVPLPHPLIAKTIIEIARTIIRTGGLTSVCFMFAFSPGIVLSHDVNYKGLKREGP